ncbi:MAG: hypothetical protein OXN15_03335 [Chloroflexota bacterium]|nr:hypothetical protein [Chloroflexota bacterium]MDE2969029.1 hypothetical protein [Chloroflexota bacterium]
MRVNARRGPAGLLNGTVLGFLLMLGLLGLTTYLIFTVRSDLDIALVDDEENAAELQRQVAGRTSAEAQVAVLQQQQAALQQQVDDARIARGVTEAALQRETETRTAAEQESINQELAKNEALRMVEREQQARLAAEARVEEEMEAAEEARREAARERTARLQAQRQLTGEMTQAATDLAREKALAEIVTRGIVNGVITYTVDDLPDFAAEGVDEMVTMVDADLAAWTVLGFSVSHSGPQETPDFTVGWIREAGDHIDPAVGQTNRVLVPLGETDCTGAWRAYDAETVRRLYWHELGHVFGYGNSSDETNVMYADLETKFAAGRDIELVMAPNITHVIPLCGDGIFSLVFEEPAAGQGSYQFAVLKPEVPPEGYFEDENHLLGCSKPPDSYINECVVNEEGASVIVYTFDLIERISAMITKSVTLPEITMEWDAGNFRYTDAELMELEAMFG